MGQSRQSAELIDEVATAVRKIRGVGKVVNLLHPPGTEAPHPPADPQGAQRVR